MGARARAGARFLAGLALAALYAGAGAHAENCALGRIGTIPLDPASRIPVMRVTLGGVERRFAINTAAPFSALTPELVPALGLKAVTIESHDVYAGGRRAAAYVTVPEFALIPGVAPIRLRMMVNPASLADDRLDGLLGVDLLENFDLDFDFAHHALNLIAPKHCKGQVVYWTRDYAAIPFRRDYSQHITVPMSLDGKPVTAVIDTAAGGTRLFEDPARRLFGLSAASVGAEPPPAGADPLFLKFRYRFDALAMRSVSVSHPLVSVIADLNRKAFERRIDDKSRADPVTAPTLEQPDLAVGMDVLEHVHLYIAYGENTLYVSAADAH